MKQHPAIYWRNQKKQRQLLGKVGVIISLTKLSGSLRWSALIQLDKSKITGAVISNFQAPKIGDQVVAVLRIIEKEGSKGLIKYGIKFQTL